MKQPATVIGAGFAGSEAAYQLLLRGIPVRMYEMRPQKMTPAHRTGGFAELVCSNSLRADRLENGPGLLKEEMRRIGSVVMRHADANRVPAGGALAVTAKASPAELPTSLKHTLCLRCCAKSARRSPTAPVSLRPRHGAVEIVVPPAVASGAENRLHIE